jgi:RND family efflux transporter MFP subunit
VAAATLIIFSCFQAAHAELMEYSCVTEAAQDATLSFTVSGRIVEIIHREGATVKEGTPIVRLEHRLEELDVERRKLLLEDKSELQAAEVRSRTLIELAASTRRLFESTGSVSQEELSRLEVEAKTAESEFQRLMIAEERERVDYNAALANLDKRTLKAPFSGTIVDVSLAEGEICEANQPLIQLVEIRRGFLICNIEEPVARNLSAGDDVPVSIQAGHGRWQSEGEVVFVAPVVDPASGLTRVKIKFENKDGQVRPGVPGYVSLETDTQSVGSAW